MMMIGLAVLDLGPISGHGTWQLLDGLLRKISTLLEQKANKPKHITSSYSC